MTFSSVQKRSHDDRRLGHRDLNFSWRLWEELLTRLVPLPAGFLDVQSALDQTGFVPTEQRGAKSQPASHVSERIFSSSYFGDISFPFSRDFQ